ncbi:hypothetical protein JZ751_015960 [Albula glossodonta]|uniref:Uncharacterized protein n=1 Tax=Albula glossodonta TaxID=121402 RepID=A0A8T2NNY5_9TELE|nr:hypothetical protein JZ751_015960 [Albula glossodonta]
MMETKGFHFRSVFLRPGSRLLALLLFALCHLQGLQRGSPHPVTLLQVPEVLGQAVNPGVESGDGPLLGLVSGTLPPPSVKTGRLSLFTSSKANLCALSGQLHEGGNVPVEPCGLVATTRDGTCFTADILPPGKQDAVISCSSLSFFCPTRSMQSSMEPLLISFITLTVLPWEKQGTYSILFFMQNSTLSIQVTPRTPPHPPPAPRLVSPGLSHPVAAVLRLLVVVGVAVDVVQDDDVS